MVSRMRAFTIAGVWIAGGLALGLTGIGLTSGEPRSGGLLAAAAGALAGGLRWGALLLPVCLLLAGLWIAYGSRRPRTAASLGGEAAMLSLAIVLAGLLLVMVAGQLLSHQG